MSDKMKFLIVAIVITAGNCFCFTPVVAECTLQQVNVLDCIGVILVAIAYSIGLIFLSDH